MIPEKLNPEEISEIQKLSAEGLTQEEISRKLGRSISTVNKYIREKKEQVGRRVSRFLGDGELHSLCELLVPLMREKLKEGNPSELPDEGENKENNGKEEEMSNGDVESKAQEIVDRREILKKLDKVEQIAKDVEVLKSQRGEVPEGLAQEIAEMKASIEGNTKQTTEFCKLYPEFCRKTEAAIDKKVEEMKPKGILGTDLNLDELLKNEKSQRVLAEKYLSDIGLRIALERCTSPECLKLRQLAKEKGIKIQKKREGFNMLGSEWDDLDKE